MRSRRASANPPAAGPHETSPPPAAAAHAVHFYESEDCLHEAVARFLGEGLRQREPLLVLATSARQESFLHALRRHGHDPDPALEARALTFADADEALDTFMTGSVPDEDRFRDLVGGLLARARSGDRPIRAYGELVDVLWRRGNTAAALRVEELWNELAASHAFSLFCAYSLQHFGSAEQAGGFHAVCDRHSHVIPALLPGDPAVQARRLAELQQRAVSLEQELERRRMLEATLRDALRERRRAERALRAAVDHAEQASRAKSDFLAVMSHELRTPLNAIIGYDELLAMEVGGPVTDQQRGYIERIRGAAQQLLGHIEQILSLSRLESGEEYVDLETVDAAALVADAAAMIEPIARQRGLTLSIALPPEPVCLVTDAGKLRQILLNLLANAAKFTDAGGVEVRVGRSGAGVYFAVSDTGPGIAPADAERIFRRFVQGESGATRRTGGTGLGLSVSRDLARLLGGDIVLDTAPGRGSTFTLTLPSADVPTDRPT